ncbi:MAG: GTP-binding protein [Alphaproteobacteria bacterium TMED93]|nr:MAG: GTP-binding protein [Alphaproteobacteria bacterium TMED93]
MSKIWVKNYGDRRQEIVFIGIANQMDKNIIKNKLDGFLIKNYSINLENSLKFKDPFPEWFKNNS